jgi:hypothetical protein
MGERSDCIATLSEIRMRFDVLMQPVKPTVIKFIEKCRFEIGEHALLLCLLVTVN